MIGKLLFLCLIVLFINIGYGQSITGVVKGIVRDKETFQPIVGAKIEIFTKNNHFATITNIDGLFKLDQIPVSKQTIVVSYIGYETRYYSNVEVSSKEVVLEINLIEKVDVLKVVEVTGNKNDY